MIIEYKYFYEYLCSKFILNIIIYLYIFLSSWDVASYSECSVTCGKGIRRIHWQCIRKDIYDTKEILDDIMCSHVAKQDPSEGIICERTCPEWKFSEWTPVGQKTCIKLNSLKNSVITDFLSLSFSVRVPRVCRTGRRVVWILQENICLTICATPPYGNCNKIARAVARNGSKDLGHQ